jgi:NosR/NirI family nitrous oxide reductase transcriptional regulator
MLLPFPRFIATLWMALALLLGALAPGAQAASGTYEAELPAGLATATDMCALLPCKDVFPGATEFSDRMGQPPYVEAYDKAGEGRQLLGYVMLSTDITDTPAYSGKPVVTLIGMDKTGHFVGVKVLKHSEPILLLGIPESALLNFNNQYLGKSVADKLEIGQSRPDEDVVGLDAISGATVTVIAQNQVMMASGSAVARQVGILAPVVREAARYKVRGEALTWDELVGRRAVEHLRVMPEQLGQDRSADPFIELWFGDLSHPDIGKSVLGEADWENLHRQLKEGEHAIFVIRTAGRESFKGSGFVRGGLYDRVQVKQGADSFTFRDLDYLNLYGVKAAGAPEFNESAIFIVRSKAFSDATLKFLCWAPRGPPPGGKLSFDTVLAACFHAEGGRPGVVEPDAPCASKSRA